ncbi:hypothetical protein ACSYDW_09115 [Paeniglutamicibacter sp. R2-26]|uniref:hypothetical protein n=1 Tax=Paeniglutamicibacter sp. R2-26 TaxID=3144417 RepID=UPI003EE573CB
MIVSDLLKSLLRRWYIVLVGLCVTAGMVFVAYSITPVTYKATATVVLLPPKKSVAEGDNPYLYMGGLGQALNVLVITMNSASTQAEVLNGRDGLGYALEQDTTTTGPIINITTAAPTNTEALDLLGQVVELVPQTLDGLQSQLEVPGNAKIGSMTLAQAHEADTENKRQLQLMAGAGAAGLIGTVLAVAAIDKLLVKRAGKRNRPKRDKGGSTGAEDEKPLVKDSDEQGTPMVPDTSLAQLHRSGMASGS